MPPTLSPSSRVRSRTSDISDFLRGRHDPKTSSDLQPPPPVPYLPEPVTPPKNRSKFAFLGRKRKPSFSPSPANTGVAAAATAAAAVATPTGARDDHDGEVVHGGNQPPAAGPSGRTPSRDLPPLPPLDIIAPGYRSRSDTARTSLASPTKGQYASPSSVLLNMRKQKGSFESNRRSTDSRSSMRPIITVSPPHNTMHEAAGAYTAPRSAPGPPSPQRPNESSLPTPTASDRSDRTATPETPTSADIPSPSTSTHSIAQLPSMFPPDPMASATSFKEESFLRKDHFDIGRSEAQPRRGTVSFNSSNPTPPATVDFSPSRQERRHFSVLQLNRLKKEITATAPKIRKMPSDPKSLAAQTSPHDAPALSRSNTVAASNSRSSHSPQSSRAPTPQQQPRRIPPPLKRTWHAPPATGPPKEPLPSPPASGARSAQTPTTSDSFRTARSPSPVSPRRTLPPLVLSRTETVPSRAQGAKSPDSLASMSIPPSPSRTTSDVETDREAPSIRTPVREDPVLLVLGDQNATPEQLREALRLQHEKYTRLSAYLLSLTERHALEKAEMMHRVEALEADAARCEREMKGLKWLVANGGKDSLRPDPARADSNTLPRAQPGPPAPVRKMFASPHDRSASIRSAASLGSDSLRMSFDSPAGSVEEGLVELQTTISEFIAAPAASPSVVAPGGPALKTRSRRSNTVPNASSGVPQFPPATFASRQVGPGSKLARRTSSPVIPGPSTSSIAASPSSGSGSSVGSPMVKRAHAGLGLGLPMPDASPSILGSRSPSPGADRDMHARSDSSTLSSLPSLSTLHSSSSIGSGLSSIPETPRTGTMFGFQGQGGFVREIPSLTRRLSASSVSVAASASSASSPSVSIGQVLDRTKPGRDRAASAHVRTGSGVRGQQPEMDEILRRLRAFGQGRGGSP